MDAVLAILDGWGLGAGADPEWTGGRPVPSGGRDAVATADTPVFDRLRRAGAYGTLSASGRSVGLPGGQMGNSEVGHLTIGAGRPVERAFTRIEDAVADDSLADRPAIAETFAHVRATGGRVHLLGLVSDGGVHSHQRHLHALVEAAADRGVEAVTHAITDGRDTPPRSATGYLRDLQATVDGAGTGRVATVSGRYYAMDRDRNWERTHRAYRAMVDRAADHRAETAVGAVEAGYDRGETDEFLAPTLVEGGPALAAGDAVLATNFRADRMRQVVRMVGDVDPEWPFETDPPDVRVTTMTEYDDDFPFDVAFPPRQPPDVLGAVAAEGGRTQLRIAESEKYPHVTYFLNGGRERRFEGERRRIVDSPDVATYDLQPEMSAPAVTDAAVEVFAADDPDLAVLNYANPDMVGHTGDFEAAVAAVEAVDRSLGRLVAAARDRGAHVLVTADHGNAEEMGTPEDPHTAHTTNPVPVVYLAPDAPLAVDPSGAGGPSASVGSSGGSDDSLSPGVADGGYRVREGAGLAAVAPTLLSLLDLRVPAAMTDPLLVDR